MRITDGAHYSLTLGQGDNCVLSNEMTMLTMLDLNGIMSDENNRQRMLFSDPRTGLQLHPVECGISSDPRTGLQLNPVK